MEWPRTTPRHRGVSSSVGSTGPFAWKRKAVSRSKAGVSLLWFTNSITDHDPHLLFPTRVSPVIRGASHLLLPFNLRLELYQKGKICFPESQRNSPADFLCMPWNQNPAQPSDPQKVPNFMSDSSCNFTSGEWLPLSLWLPSCKQAWATHQRKHVCDRTCHTRSREAAGRKALAITACSHISARIPSRGPFSRHLGPGHHPRSQDSSNPQPAPRLPHPVPDPLLKNVPSPESLKLLGLRASLQLKNWGPKRASVHMICVYYSLFYEKLKKNFKYLLSHLITINNNKYN